MNIDPNLDDTNDGWRAIDKDSPVEGTVMLTDKDKSVTWMGYKGIMPPSDSEFWAQAAYWKLP